MKIGLKRGAVRVACIVLVGSGSVAVSATGAAADEAAAPATVQGIQPLPAGYARLADLPDIKANAPVTDAKYRVFELWAEKAELKAGDASAMQLAEIDTQIASAQAKVARLDGDPIVPSSASKVAAAAGVAAPAAFPTPAAARTLNLTHSAQSNGYYCGPATTAMVIRMSGGSETSKYNSSHKMSQTMLASSTYLQITTSGTSIQRIPTALKRWMNLSTDVYAGPSATKLKNLVTGSIGVLSHGVAYGTRELTGGAHYNGHPTNSRIDHFIAGHCYTDEGVYLKYADPATSVWSGVKKTNSMRAYQMRDFIAPWGVVA